MVNFIRILSIIVVLLWGESVYSDSVIDELMGTSEVGQEAVTIVRERILRISHSGKIFLISNDNSSYGPGDYISLIYQDNLVARAIVAKVQGAVGGIKIIKIYSLPFWKQFMQGVELQVLRGDDSYFKSKSIGEDGENSEELKGGLISSEENLFDETTITGDIDDDEDKDRVIKSDNIITGCYGSVEGRDVAGNNVGYKQFSAQWAYQFEDNFWAEISYGESIVEDYPVLGLGTKLSSIILRAKYTFNAPFYSYLQPYLGYQIINASSPGAGKGVDSGTDADYEYEHQLVEDLKKNKLIFGVTWLKRLVPGWFFKLSLGTDIMNVGFGLEF